MTTHNGKPIFQRGGAGAGRGDDAHGVTESESELNARMQAREDSYGEAGEYEAEAAYAAQYQDSEEPREEPKDENWSWLRQQFAENYRRGY
jgi:hypothetical protein